jgi:hypothetical protein
VRSHIRPPKLTVEKTVKPLKTRENSTTCKNIRKKLRRAKRTGRPIEEARGGGKKRRIGLFACIPDTCCQDKTGAVHFFAQGKEMVE